MSYRVIHYVYGGGSGATRKAEEVAVGNHQSKLFQAHVIYRGKPRNTALLNQAGVSYSVIDTDSKLEMIRNLIDEINKFDADIVVSHGYKEHVYGRMAAVRAKVPTIIQVEHSTQPYIISYYIMSQILSMYTDRIICVSNAVKKNLSRIFFNEDKMNVIHNGFYIDKYYNDTPIEKRLPGVIMVARFSSAKDQETLIKAARILKDKKIHCPISLVGTGKDRHINKCKELCKKLDVEDMISFLGRRQDVPELLAKHQIFVLSTNYEGLSGVVMEAMAAGNVVIATDASGVSEIINDGETGFLVPPKSAKILAERIASVLNCPESYSKMIKNAQKDMKDNYTVEKMVRKYEEIFKQELKKREEL